MYQFPLHSCSVNGSDTDFSKLLDSSKLKIFGKDSDSNTWISSNKIQSNHVASKDNDDWNQDFKQTFKFSIAFLTLYSIIILCCRLGCDTQMLP